MKQHVVTERPFQDGEPVITEGNWPYYAYLVLSGRARVLRSFGSRRVTVSTLEEGDLFGEMSLLGDTKHHATVVADGSLTVGMIPKASFMQLLGELPEEERSRLLRLSHDVTYLNDIRARLAFCVEELSDMQARSAADREELQRQMDVLPEDARQVAALVHDRFHSSVEACSELMKQLATMESETTSTT